jgi:hypothetical protein
MVGNVPTTGKVAVVPAPPGIHNWAKPLPSKAIFQVPGVRQWCSRAATGGAQSTDGVVKAKYDPARQLLDEQADERINEYLGRYMSVSEQARNALQQRFAQKAAINDLEQYEQLINSGLTDKESGEVMRRRVVEKAIKNPKHVDYHQQQKDVIAHLALTRNLRVGLPQSMATFAGITTPNLNYSAKEVHGVKRLLHYRLKDLDRKRAAESMIGQNTHMFPKPTDPGWSHNVPRGTPLGAPLAVPANAAATVGLQSTVGNSLIAAEESGSTLERLLRIHDAAIGAGRAGADLSEVSSRRLPGLETREQYEGGGSSREERLQEIAENAAFSSSSSYLREPEERAGGGAASGGATGGAGGRRGRPVAGIPSASEFATNSIGRSNASQYIASIADKIGIDVDDPKYKKAGGRYKDIDLIRRDTLSLLRRREED